jgi:hypothetical protein
LIAALVVRFEARTLRVAAGLPHAEALEREAAAFTMKLSASGHDSYSAREGEHDDLLLAVSLPVWHVGQRPPPAASASVVPAPDTYRAERHTLMAGLGRRRLI